MFQIGQDQNAPTVHWFAVGFSDIGRRKLAVRVVVVGDRQRDLF